MQRFVQRSQHSTALAGVLPGFALLLTVLILHGYIAGLNAQTLPDAPSALLAASLPADADTADADPQNTRHKLPPCTDLDFKAAPGQIRPPCREENPIQPIVSSSRVKRLTVTDKGVLAYRDVIDPFNLITIAGTSAITVAAQSHSAYGPGFKGFGELTGYSLTEDIIGETLATFAIPSIAHEDPRYHRMPGRPFGRRLLHALAHTWVSQHDDGRTMPNYAILLTYPIAAEIFNLYVPGIATDAPATGKRILVGLATNPADDIVSEFLPDVAKRIHVRIVFVQQIMNQVALGSPGTL
jgi:hypothetical protein